MAKRPVCTFTFVGHPVTAPGTPDDAKRIKLSQWITAILVRDGDEQAGEYIVPGDSGYTSQQIAEAPTRYAHLLERRPSVPEPELQLQALALLRAGVNTRDIAEELELPLVRFAEWRTSEVFAAEWEAAKAEGSGKKVRSNVHRDAALARRVPEELPQPVPQPTVCTMNNTPTKRKGLVPAYTDAELQKLVLVEIRNGCPSSELVKSKKFKGYNSNRLAKWRADADFNKIYTDAMREGLNHRPPGAKLRQVRINGAAAVPAGESLPALAVTADAVNGPLHYNGTEVIDQMARLFGKEAVTMFCKLNAYKYRMRAGKKPGNSIGQDINKALWYENYLEKIAA